MTVINFEGHHISTRTRDMIVEARRITKAPLEITQGGYNAGAVKDSAGTHDRDALDIRAKTLSAAERAEAVLRCRQVGFAAWIRTVAQGFEVVHIHCVPIGGDLSPSAARQVTAYKNGRNGLSSNGKDDGPRLYVQTWETYLKRRGPLPTPKPSNPSGGTDMPLTEAEWTRLKDLIDDRLNDQDRQLWVEGTGKSQVIDPIKAIQTTLKDHTNRLTRIEDDTDDGTAPKA